MSWLMVALGGALGSVGRYGIGLSLARFSAFPVGTLLAERAGKAGISKVVFDRNGFQYHGRVKSRMWWPV